MKEVDDLESKAREQERLIEEKKRELEELANTAGDLGEMAALQNAAVKNKLYKLMSGLDADNSDALPSKDTSHDTHLLNGDVVMIDDQKGLAIVRFVGEVEFSDQVMLGAELSDPIGDCNGTKDNTTYFSCPPNHGVFFPLQGVKKKIPSRAFAAKAACDREETEYE